MLRKIKNKKGQIGEILVIVVLIILAVLGVLKYVVPMFDKSGKVAAKTDVDSTVTSISLQSGQIVSGASMQAYWGQLCKQAEPSTLVIANGSSEHEYLTASPAEGNQAAISNRNKSFYEMYSVQGVDVQPDDMANYKATIVKYQNGEINTLTFTKQ